MATLERVMQLKQQGFAEPQIIQSLTQEGVSPKEINEAISQSKIKTELAPQTEASFPGTETQIPQAQATPGQMPAQPTAVPETQIPQAQPQAPTAPMPTPTAQELPAFAKEIATSPQQMQPSIMTTQPTEMQPPAQAPNQEYTAYPPQNETMPYYEEYQNAQPADIETINDIAEQIVEEKTTSIKKQITEFTRFKDELTLGVNQINARLLRIENTFNELQMAILGKIGEYGEDIKNISKEMHATQDSFSKIINPLTDNIRELEKLTGKKESKSRPTPKTKKRKTKDEIESYLR